MHFARFENADKSETRRRLDSLISVIANANKNCSRGLARHLRLGVGTLECVYRTANIDGRDFRKRLGCYEFYLLRLAGRETL